MKDCYRIIDETQYVEGKSSDGGCCLFWEDYWREGGVYRVSYGTSAEFPYCDRWGRFQECMSCPMCVEGECIQEYGSVDPVGLAGRLEEKELTEGWRIE